MEADPARLATLLKVAGVELVELGLEDELVVGLIAAADVAPAAELYDL